MLEGTEGQEVTKNTDEPVVMRCPICLKSVVKVRETDIHIKHNIVHENDFYQHYTDANGDDKLIRFKHPPERQILEEKLNYAPFRNT